MYFTCVHLYDSTQREHKYFKHKKENKFTVFSVIRRCIFKKMQSIIHKRCQVAIRQWCIACSRVAAAARARAPQCCGTSTAAREPRWLERRATRPPRSTRARGLPACWTSSILLYWNRCKIKA